MPIINVENAEIKTASIEIKALTLNKRQVTQSVFKQILEENVLNDETITFNGLIWGYINFQVAPECLHILWQKGKELRRFILRKKYNANDLQADGFFKSDFQHYFKSKRKIDEITYGEGRRDWENLNSISIADIEERQEAHWATDGEKEKYKLHLLMRKNKFDEAFNRQTAAETVISNKTEQLNRLIISLQDLSQLFIAV